MWSLAALFVSVGVFIALVALVIRIEPSSRLRTLAAFGSLAFGALGMLAEIHNQRLQVALVAAMASIPLAMLVWDTHFTRALQANRWWAWRYTKLEFLLLPVLLVTLLLVALFSGDG